MSAEADLALLVEGVARFNAGAHHEAHEAWEDLWLRNRSPARPFFQGLIQAAAAFHHLGRGKPGPAARLLDAAAGRLAPFSPAFLGVAVAPLLVDLAAARAHAGRTPQADLACADPARPPTIAFVAPDLDAFRPHRGTEPHPLRRLAAEPRREPDVRS